MTQTSGEAPESSWFREQKFPTHVLFEGKTIPFFSLDKKVSLKVNKAIAGLMCTLIELVYGCL